MVTIQAPGIEINEIDLSFYDFPGPREETTNVYVTGFASKGLNYTPYKFTSKNTAQDIIDTFGVPENEAERYFYNACVEVISKPKTVLYASRLPYANTAISTIVGAEYAVSTVGSISSDYQYFLGLVKGECTSESQISSGVAISCFGSVPTRRSFYFTDFAKIGDLPGGTYDKALVKEIVPDEEKSDVSCSVSSFTLTSGWSELSGTELSDIAEYKYDFKLDTPVTVESAIAFTDITLEAGQGILIDTADTATITIPGVDL